MRRSVGDTNYTPIILLGAVAFAGYMVYEKFFGPSVNDQNNAGITQGTTDSISTDIAAQTAAGGVKTLSNAIASGIATQLWSLGLDNPGPADQDKMVRLIIQANTALDLLTIEKYFGTKQAAADIFSTCYYFGTNCQAYDLATWLGATLDYQHLSTVNNYFSSLGIFTSF